MTQGELFDMGATGLDVSEVPEMLRTMPVGSTFPALHGYRALTEPVVEDDGFVLDWAWFIVPPRE